MPQATEERLYISEIFCSIQGEGMLTGTPSVFIRTSGCNLRCRWCDTPYTSWAATGEHIALSDIVAEVERHAPVTHVVLTGGEPMIAKHVGALAGALSHRGMHLTVETAGTVFVPLPVDLWSVSPKLATSTPLDDADGWRARHEATRIAPDVLARFVASGAYQLKFVVCERADLDEINALVNTLGAAADRVVLMPEGRDIASLDAIAKWLVPACLSLGYRFGDRLQIRLFGDTRGT